MDTLEQYRQAIREVLNEYASLPRGELSSETIFDEKADRYLLMALGWEGVERVHYCVAHIEIIDGKVWIQRDGTEVGLAYELERKGIPKRHIVLGFHEPDVRRFTDYAAA
jgi:hypothetical protein